MSKKLSKLEGIGEHPLVILLSRFSSFAVLPVLGFIGMFIFNGVEELKTEQTQTNVSIAVIQTTLPILTDKIKENKNQIESVESQLSSHEEVTGDNSAAIQKRSKDIKQLQEELKQLIKKLSMASDPNEKLMITGELQHHQQQLALLITN